MASTTTHDGDSSLTLDDRLFPVLLTTWRGPATHPLADELDAWMAKQIARAERGGLRLLIIADARTAGLPTAAMRQRFADSPSNPIFLPSIVVTNNTVVLGAMTAIRWLMGERYDLHCASTLDDAMREAAKLFTEAGLEVPRGLDEAQAS